MPVRKNLFCLRTNRKYFSSKIFEGKGITWVPTGENNDCKFLIFFMLKNVPAIRSLSSLACDPA